MIVPRPSARCVREMSVSIRSCSDLVCRESRPEIITMRCSGNSVERAISHRGVNKESPEHEEEADQDERRAK